MNNHQENSQTNWKISKTAESHNDVNMSHKMLYRKLLFENKL